MIRCTNFKAILIATTCLVFACTNDQSKPVEIPATVLSSEKLEQVLVDFALAESASNMNVKNVAIQRLDTVYAFNPLKENNVRKSQYDSTLSFYSKHPELYKKIYENVLARLTGMQTRRDSLRLDSATIKK